VVDRGRPGRAALLSGRPRRFPAHRTRIHHVRAAPACPSPLPPWRRPGRWGLAWLGAQAQSLKELYEAARAYDATYLAARRWPSRRVPRGAGRGAEPALGALTAARPRDRRSRHRWAAGGQQFHRSAGLSGSLPAVQPQPTAPPSTRPASRWSVSRPTSSRRAGPDRARGAGLLRRAGSAGHAGHHAANKTAITEQLASAKRNFEVGTATITDTREAQARFDLATAQEIAADNDLRTKRIALDQLVGRAATSRPSRWPCRWHAAAGAAADVEAWVLRADAQHPTVRRARSAWTWPARDREGPRRRTCPRSTRWASPSASSGASGSRCRAAGTTNTPASACSSTCRCTPVARSRTASRKRWCWKRSRATTSTPRAAAWRRARAGLLRRAVGPGPGQGAGGGRVVEPSWRSKPRSSATASACASTSTC
jgi:hypothetical protein